MNSMIKKIEIDPDQLGQSEYSYGQYFEIWHDNSDIDLLELWRTTLDDNTDIALTMSVDYREVYPNNEINHLLTPCCLFVWGKRGRDVVDAVFAVLRRELEIISVGEQNPVLWSL